MRAIGYRVDAGLAVISLETAADGNRLDPVMLTDLEQAIARAHADKDVRALALVSVGRPGEPFCHGMNLDALSDTLSSAPSASSGTQADDVRAAAVDAYARILELLAFGPKPSLALVDGTVKAGGVGLVAACDFVLADPAASFELTEVFFGLIPANVLPWLASWRMSPSRARFWTLSALPLDAPAARAEGLVDILAEAGGLDSALKALCKQLWRAEPGAMAAAKRFFREIQEMVPARSREHARGALLERMASPAVAEAMASLRGGESPSWFGRFKPAGPIANPKE